MVSHEMWRQSLLASDCQSSILLVDYANRTNEHEHQNNSNKAGNADFT
jgi:hypothetical protein